MLKVLLGFLPWILYFVLSGNTQKQHGIALAVALAITVVLDRKELKKGFILTWGGFFFFSILLLVTLFTNFSWPSEHSGLLGNVALMMIVWISFIIQKPFTLQYAREEVDPQFWHTPIFIRINNILTIVWGLSFTVLTAMSLLRYYLHFPDSLLYEASTYLPTLIAIWITSVFPDWYQARFSEKLIKAGFEKQKDNFFLKDNFKPVQNEMHVSNLPVIGKIPSSLKGIYMRNGPNPQFSPFSYTFPFDGDGMIHALYFDNGKVTYRNKFIVTDQLQTERRLGKAVYGGVDCPVIRDESKLLPTDSKMPIKIGRFIHVIRQADTYLALHEASSAYQINDRLETLSEWNPTHSEKAVEVNAHTRVDPETGERVFIAYNTDKPEINILVLNGDANVIKQDKIEVPFISMVHDFVMTKNYIVIFLCPVVIDLFNTEGAIAWKPEYGTKIAVISRHELSQNIVWIDTEPFFTFHFANGYENKTNLIIDHVRYEKFSMDMDDIPDPKLTRSVIDLEKMNCVHTFLDHRNIEFPRINEAYDTHQNRYIYALLSIENNMQAVIKYDLEKNISSVHDFGKTAKLGEAIFIPKENASSEDDGTLIFYLYDELKKSSECILLDARDVAAEPLARIQMPQRVPQGLHGSWMS